MTFPPRWFDEIDLFHLGTLAAARGYFSAPSGRGSPFHSLARMKQPALFKHLSESARASVSLAELGASYVEVSVQSDKTVVQLWFSGLPSPFGREAALTTLERIRMQLLGGAFSTEDFSLLTYTPADVRRLWLFISEDYGTGSAPVCNFCNGELEWTITQQTSAAP